MMPAIFPCGRLCFKVVTILALGLLLVRVWLLHSEVPAQASRSDRVRDLQEQRLDTLRDLVTQRPNITKKGWRALMTVVCDQGER